MSAGENNPQPKEIGFRNTFDVSPWFQGQKITPESGCTQALVETYGEFQGIIIIAGERSGFEHQGCSLADVRSGQCPKPNWNDFYLYVDATNSDNQHWSRGCPDHCAGTFTQAGPRTYCVSYAHLDHYKCVDCTMTDAGKTVGCGARYDLKK